MKQLILVLVFFFLACDQEPISNQPLLSVSRPDLEVCPIVNPLPDVVTPIASNKTRLEETARNQSRSANADLKRHAEHAQKLLGTYPPHKGIKINDAEFYLSKTLCTAGTSRPSAVLFSVINNVIRAYPMYRSLSNGIWRSSSGFLGIYQKGIHYTQDFLPHQKITDMLDSNEMGSCQAIPTDLLRSEFDLLRRPATEESNAIDVSFTHHFQKYRLGVGLDSVGDKQAFLNSMTKEQLPAGFYPEFSCLARSYETSHSLISELAVDANHVARKKTISVDVFLARLNNRPIEWHFAYEKGTTEPWIARIRFAKSNIRELGNDADVIMSGALTLKPFEYTAQVKNLVEGEDFRSSPVVEYVDVRPFIQNFPPIKDYKAYKDRTASWE